jgi:ATP-dependent DNA helicase RecG
MKEGILGAEVAEKKPGGKTIHKTAQKTTQKAAHKVMGLIRHKPEITRQELAIELGITDSGVKYHLKKMQAKGLIRRVGPDKGGHWEVVQENEDHGHGE